MGVNGIQRWCVQAEKSDLQSLGGVSVTHLYYSDERAQQKKRSRSKEQVGHVTSLTSLPFVPAPSTRYNRPWRTSTCQQEGAFSCLHSHPLRNTHTPCPSHCLPLTTLPSHGDCALA